MPDAIHLGEPAIEVRLRRSARARRMILRVAQAGSPPVLTLPHGASIPAMRAFLLAHEDWLRRAMAARPERTPIVDGTVLPFGDARLEIRRGGARRLYRSGEVLHVPGTEGRLPGRVAAYLREAARAKCVAAVERHAAVLGKWPGRITLRDTRSRWGSCTAAGDLMFSWRLALTPERVLDYVVAHEVAHLAELNHSARFWSVVRRLSPEYENPRAWLRKHGAGVHSYDFAGIGRGSGPA